MKKQKKKAKVHPELDEFGVEISEFGEIKGTIDVDKINKFLDRNVEDKKLIDREEKES